MDPSPRSSARPGPTGVGIGLRRAHFDEFLASPRHVDWVEVTTESFVGVGGLAARALAAALERGPVVPHGVSLNLGGCDPLDAARLDAFARFADALDAPWYSDHVCTSAIDGVESFDLLPLPFCEEAAEHVAARARAARAVLGRRLVLENITWYSAMPGTTWTEGRFLREVLTAADAGLLLDVANVVVNARNHRVDAIELLESLPLERTQQIHLAGHRHEPRWDIVLDDHASPVSEETLQLYVHALRRIGRPVPTLIEWDQNVPTLPALLDQAESVARRARDALEAD